MHVLDLHDDLGASLSAALEGGEVPELLKTAEWKEPYEALDRDFALILVDDEREHRKYACHDAGNTAVSMFYLSHAAEHLSPAATKVAAANLARIGGEQGLTIPEDISKLASGPLDARDVIDERRVRYRPVREKVASRKLAGFNLVKAVAQRWDGLAPHEKRASALALQAESTQLPLSIPDHIYAYSGTELSEKFASHMGQRARWTEGRDVSDEYGRLSKVASVLGPDESLKVLFELDKVAGIRWAGGDKYGSHLADPYLCVYGTVKEAMWAWSHGADNVNEAQLKAFSCKPESNAVFTSTFSDGLWMRFQQSPLATFKGMPVEQQVLVSRMARQT